MPNHEFYVDLLRKNGIELAGKTVLDVGCGHGEFVQYAREHGAGESWGIEHNSRVLKTGLQFGHMTADDMVCCLDMPFSEVPKKCPDLKGKFDIIKITAVTPYANAHELTHMAHTAHFLLKKDGHVLIELPWLNLMGRAFQAGNSAEENTSVVNTYLGSAKTGVVRRESERLQVAYRTLFKAYFGESIELKSVGGVPALLVGSPKEIIPDITGIKFDTFTLRLGQISGQPSVARKVE